MGLSERRIAARPVPGQSAGLNEAVAARADEEYVLERGGYVK
jgi:hypothetical protein